MNCDRRKLNSNGFQSFKPSNFTMKRQAASFLHPVICALSRPYDVVTALLWGVGDIHKRTLFDIYRESPVLSPVSSDMGKIEPTSMMWQSVDAAS